MNTNIKPNNNQSGIYKITNKTNGMFYIGSTKNFRKRYREHNSQLLKGSHINNYLQHSYNKYGKENFYFEVIEVVNDTENLIIVEQRYLDNLNAYDNKIGYNVSKQARSYVVSGEEHHHFGVPKTSEQKRKTSDSLMGHVQSKETKNRISKAVKGKNTGKDHWSYGKERSKQHRERLSASMKGKFLGEKNPFYGKAHSKETKIKMGIPVVQLTLKNEYVNTFDSAKQAAKENNMSQNHIGCVCKNKRKTSGGYKWMYKEEYEKLVTQ